MLQLTFNNIIGNGEIHYDVLKSICGDTCNKSMVDIMCCEAPTTRKLGFKYKLYIDVLDWDLTEENNYFVQMDAFEYLKKAKYKDVMFCCDGIEHVTIEQGNELIKLMGLKSDKQILMTPLGDILGMSGLHNNNPTEHRSLWTPDMFEGYASIVFPDWHKQWNGGCFFVFKCNKLEQDFERVSIELKNKSWAK